MANLGINIKVNFGDAMDALDAFERRWKALAKDDLKVKVKVDDTKVKALEKTINRLKHSDDKGINLKLNTAEAMSDLRSFKNKFNSVKSDIEKGFNIKLGNGGFDSRGMDSAVRSSNTLTSGLKSAQQATYKINRTYGDLNGMAQKFARVNSKSVQEATAGQKKMSDSRIANEKLTSQMARKEATALKEIASLTKEIGKLSSQSLSKSPQEREVMSARIGTLTDEMNEYKRVYEKTFGKSSDDNWVVKKSQDLADYNVNMKKASLSAAEHANIEKQKEAVFKQYAKAENERFTLQQKAMNSYGREAEALQNEANSRMLDAARIMEHGKKIGLTSDETAKLAALSKEAEVMAVQNRLAEKTREARRSDKDELNGVKNSLKDMFALEKQMSTLKAQEKNETLDMKGRQKLDQLQQEYKIVKDIHNAQKAAAKESGALNDENKQILDSMQRSQKEQMKRTRSVDESKAHSKLQDQEYGRLKDSMREVSRLQNQMVNAGDNEVRAIERAISAEKEKQDAIRDTIRAKQLSNKETEREISKSEKLQAERHQESREMNRASRKDRRQQYSGVMSDVFDPRNFYQEGKQAAMMMYESVATLDKQFTNIAKVADVPAETLEAFSKDIFNQASAVGKSADEYAVSVERWLTTGKTFKESQELSQVSVMGGFVGNIGEEEMVKHMSVPLQSFKNEALQAKDIVNAMNEASNNNAIEMDDLGAAYQRASQTAASAGTSFSQLTGMITGANVQTRAGGEKIGTAMKAIDLNFSKMSSGITKADSDRTAFFEGIGVNIKDQNGQLRSTYDILGDLSGKWDELNSDQKGMATMYAAGKNHAAVLQGLVTGWDDVVKATTEAEQQVGLVNKDSGSAFQEFEKQKESVEYKANALKNSWNELLNTIAGGREGVNGVLETMKSAVDFGVKLANDDGFMKLATSMLKVGAALSGLVVAGKVFGVISSGARDMNLALRQSASAIAMATSKTKGLITKNGRAERKAQKERARSQDVYVGGGSMGGKGASKVAKSTKGIGRAGAMIAGVGRGIGSLIPILGGVITAMTVLDALGIDVWGAMGKAVKKVGEAFETTGEKAEKANKKFISEQEKIGKNLKENRALNGSISDSRAALKGYEELRTAKEKAFKAGDVNAKSYTAEEFGKIKSEFDRAAELLGVDIELTMNDYDDIESKYQKLISLANQLSSKELSSGLSEGLKSTKPKDTKKDKEAWAERKEDAETKLQQEKLTRDDMERMYKNGQTTKAAYDNSEKEVAKREKELKSLENFYATKEGIEARAADRSRLANIEYGKNNLGAQAEKGFLKDSWKTLSSQEEKDFGMAQIQSYGKGLAKNAQELGRAKTDLEKVKQGFYDDWNADGAINSDKPHEVSDETLRKIRGLSDEYDGLSKNINSWGGSEKIEEIFSALDQSSVKASERLKQLKTNMKELATDSGMSTEQIEGMFKAMEGSGAEFVQYMTGLGKEIGGSMLGLGTEFLANDNWAENIQKIQSEIDSFGDKDLEKAIRLKLVKEDGLANGETLEDILGMSQMESIELKYDLVNENGEVNLQNSMKLLEDLDGKTFTSQIEVDGQANLGKFMEVFQTLDDKTKQKWLVELGVEADTSGADKVEKVAQDTKELDGKTSTIIIDAKDKSMEAVVDAKGNILSVDGMEATAILDADKNTVGFKVTTAKGEVLTFNGTEGIAKLLANDMGIAGKVVNAKSQVSQLDGDEATAYFLGDTSDIIAKKATADAQKKDSTSTHTFSAVLSGAWDTVKQFFGGGSSSVSISPPAGVLAQAQANKAKANKKSKDESVAILDRNMARSFSNSISSSVGGATTTTTKGKSSSKSSTDNKPINSDVWRYWGKELFKGMPLERSMENLENSIKKAGENFDKLIPLYKQQINLLSQQVAFEKTMQKETQSELNEVLGKLRGKGFKTNGNQITNLDRAKAFKGDSASEVEELLNKWKSLYEGLDEITGKINSLNQQKWDVEQEIKEAEISKEGKALEDSLKKTTALLTAIESHMNLLSKKEELVSESDFELKLTVQEESANDAKKNLGMLVDEFNRLSKTSIKYAENAETVKSEMESLKTEILSNADAILSYRESMNQLKIDRLIEDYDKFNETILRNTDLLNNNVDALKEGLVSGTSISDLESSKLDNLLFNRKNALDKQYQDRLQLEAKIDAALDAFSKKNIDRAKGVANAQLNIEKSKYKELLKMEKDFSNGKTPTFKEVSGGAIDLGAVKTEQSESNKTYQEWLNKLKQANDKYTAEFARMRDEFEKNMSSATSQADKDSLTNKFIIDQLKLQEKIQQNIVDLNKEAIVQAEELLKNESLTTEQREELEQAIVEYKDSSIEAQEAIRDLIKDRFEFEFDLIDKAMDKAASYSDKLEHLLDVSKLVDKDPRNKQSLIDKIYEAKANEYYNAKKALKSLQEQQSKFTEGSLEWNLLQEQIEDVDKSLKDLTVSLLEANQEVLGNKLDVMGDNLVKGVLGGKTLDEWNNYQDRWISGIEKEIELEKIRRRLLDIESDVNKEKLEMLDRQEAVSKKELEFLDKQTKVLELQDKINNLDKERSVQTLVKKDDGTWDWEYQADQSEIDDAKEELEKAEIDLEKFRQEQREKYASDIQKALDKAKDGDFENVEDLRKELEDIRNAYGSILNDLPETSMGSIEEILAAYDEYLKENGKIVDDALGGGTDAAFDDKLQKIGGMFETSFRAIAEDLGQIISDALSNALGIATGVKRMNGEQQYVIQNQELVFPNVSDTTGFEQVLLDLPQTAQQQINSK